MPSIPSSLTIMLSLVALLLNSQFVAAFVSVSRLSSAIAVGSAMDMRAQKLMTVGVDYKDDYKELTLDGQADSDCYVAVGSVRGFDRRLFQSPQMCLQIQVVAGVNASESIPDGIVTGMAGQQPLVMSLDYNSVANFRANLRDPFRLPHGYFPVATATDRNLGGIYIALHETNGLSFAPVTDDPASELINAVDYIEKLTRPKQLPGSGMNHSPIIFKYNVGTKQAEWQTTFTTEEGKSTIGGLSVVVSRGKLVAVGSSTGYGDTVGAGARSSDWDGYITIVDMENGKIDKEGTTTAINAPHSQRIYTQFDQDDFALGVCTSDEKAYVVGSTTGKMDGDEAGGGFVSMYDIDTLGVVWKRQLVGNGVEATHCAVKGNILYVAGMVPPDVVLDNPNSSNDGKASGTWDIFIALFDADNGELAWIRQIDSRRHDQMVGMVINLPGNLLITVNGRNFDDGSNDLYVMSVDQPDGKHDWQYLAEGIDPIDGTTNKDQTGSGEEDDSWIIVVAIVVPVIILLILVVYYFKTRNPSSQPKAQDSSSSPEENIGGELS